MPLIKREFIATPIRFTSCIANYFNIPLIIIVLLILNFSWVNIFLKSNHRILFANSRRTVSSALLFTAAKYWYFCLEGSLRHQLKGQNTNKTLRNYGNTHIILYLIGREEGNTLVDTKYLFFRSKYNRKYYNHCIISVFVAHDYFLDSTDYTKETFL